MMPRTLAETAYPDDTRQLAMDFARRHREFRELFADPASQTGFVTRHGFFEMLQKQNPGLSGDFGRVRDVETKCCIPRIDYLQALVRLAQKKLGPHVTLAYFIDVQP